MSPWRRVALAGAAGVAVGVVLLLVTSGADPARSLGVLLVAGALAAAVVGPWRAGLRGSACSGGPSSRARAQAAALEVLGGASGLTLAGLPLAASQGAGGGPGLLLLGAAWVALFGLALVGLTLLVGRAGQVVATAAGLLLVAWPYLGGPAAAALPADRRPAALEATLLTPVPVLGGSFAQADVMRSGGLYAAFPLGQSLPFAYAAPRAALTWAALAALTLAALALTRARLRAAWPRQGAGGPRLAAPLLALGLVAFTPGEARAQLFPQPEAGGGEPEIGPLQTRVHLGYWVPALRGYVKIDGYNDRVEGSKLSFDRVLDLEQIFVVPTFEVHLAWANAGQISLQYFEAAWYGEAVTTVPRNYEEATFPAGAYIESRYRFRTIALGGELQVPLTDFLTLRLLTTQRYVRFESKLRSVQNAISKRNSVETLVPTLGAGLDVMLMDIISLYGDVQYLDFSISWFGGNDGRWDYQYREWHVGVRLELVEHAHVMLEWFSLELTVTDGDKDRYKQELNGPRLQVAILF